MDRGYEMKCLEQRDLRASSPSWVSAKALHLPCILVKCREADCERDWKGWWRLQRWDPAAINWMLDSRHRLSSVLRAGILRYDFKLGHRPCEPFSTSLLSTLDRRSGRSCSLFSRSYASFLLSCPLTLPLTDDDFEPGYSEFIGITVARENLFREKTSHWKSINRGFPRYEL